MPNAWVEHVRAFAKKNNESYGCSISNPECKRTYYQQKDRNKKMTRTPADEMSGMGAEDVNAIVKPKSKKKKLVIKETVETFELDNGKMVTTKKFKIGDEDYYKDDDGNIYDFDLNFNDYVDQRVGIFEDDKPVFFKDELDKPLMEMGETEVIMVKLLSIIKKSPKKYPKVVAYLKQVIKAVTPSTYKKYARPTARQKKYYKLFRDSVNINQLITDDATDLLDRYGIRFAWHSSSKPINNITDADYDTTGDKKDIARLRLSSQITEDDDVILPDYQFDLIDSLELVNKKSESVLEKAAAEPKPKPKSSAAQKVLGNKDLLGLIKGFTNEFSPAELKRLKKKYGKEYDFKRDKFGNIITYYEHIGDPRIVEIKSTGKSYNFTRDDDDILAKKPLHPEFKEYAKWLKASRAYYTKFRDEFKEARGSGWARYTLKRETSKIANKYLFVEYKKTKPTEEQSRRLVKAKKQLAEMDRSRDLLGVMMDEDQREFLQDFVDEFD